MPGLVDAQDLGLELVRLGVAQVHPEQLAREQRGLIAAGAGPDLHDHVAVVVRVARQQEDLELVDEPRLVGAQAGDLLGRHRLELLVAVAGVPQLARAGELLAGRLERRGTRPRPARGGRARGRGGGCASGSVEVSGMRELRLEVVVLAGDLGQSRVEVVARHRDAHAPGSGGSIVTGVGRFRLGCDRDRRPAVVVPGRGLDSGSRVEHRRSPAGSSSPSASSACSIDTIATSIMSVGRLLRRDHLDEDPGPHDRRGRSGCRDGGRPSGGSRSRRRR